MKPSSLLRCSFFSFSHHIFPEFLLSLLSLSLSLFIILSVLLSRFSPSPRLTFWPSVTIFNWSVPHGWAIDLRRPTSCVCKLCTRRLKHGFLLRAGRTNTHTHRPHRYTHIQMHLKCIAVWLHKHPHKKTKLHRQVTLVTLERFPYQTSKQGQARMLGLQCVCYCSM